jgi:hypothetical protein
MFRSLSRSESRRGARDRHVGELGVFVSVRAVPSLTIFLIPGAFVLQFIEMSKTWTFRPSERHELARKQIGATPSEFCKRALDAFCAEGATQQARLQKLRGSVRAGANASRKEGFKR